MRSHSLRLTAIGFALGLWLTAACNCGAERLSGVPIACDLGGVSGRVCAPDQQTWVNGAALSIDATDCDGQPIHRATTSSADGTFSLPDVPPGHWTVHATLGQFMQDSPVDVSAGQTTAIPVNKLCVAQKGVQIAVITGIGDKIENLLTTLSLTYTTYAGDTAGYATGAAPFLSDLTQMKKYDIIFVDCAAAKSSTASQIDFGPNAKLIKQNLQNYVAQGGSLYASDWALLFPAFALPGKLDFLLNPAASSATVVDPLATKYLMGYAPQTVLSAQITDPGLAAFLGKSQVSIDFPKTTSTSSLHWGLLGNVAPGVQVLVAAPTVKLCDSTGTTCATASGVPATNIPLAVSFKVTAPGTKGGNVIYTSFHNIGQTNAQDVAQILKYLILHL